MQQMDVGDSSFLLVFLGQQILNIFSVWKHYKENNQTNGE